MAMAHMAISSSYLNVTNVSGPASYDLLSVSCRRPRALFSHGIVRKGKRKKEGEGKDKKERKRKCHM